MDTKKSLFTRRRAFSCLGILIVISVTSQLFIYWRAPKLHPIDEARVKSRAYNTVANFLKICDSVSVHCILVDPYILQGIVDETWEAGHSPCRFMCKNHVYTFAVREQDYDDLKMMVLRKMIENGFKVFVRYVSKNDEAGGGIPTHINLRDHDNHAIHIVVLHYRKSSMPNMKGWWWYGPNPDDEFGKEFTQQEGALDEFEYEFRVTLDGIDLYMPHFPKKFIEMYDNSKFIPCNVTRAAEFHKLYPRDERKNATAFRENGAKVLKVIKSRLDDFGVPFWLSSGTLLGWYRQCDFIVYSGDVDIGVFIKDHDQDLLSKLLRSSLVLEHKFGKLEDSLQYAFHMGSLKLDIFFFYEDKFLKKYWNGGTDYDSGAKYRYLFDKFTLCWTEFYDMKFRVPCDTERYIKANYGDNWFNPVKKWDWRHSPPNSVQNGYWDDEEMNEVIQLWDAKGKRIHLEWESDRKEEL